MYCNSTRHRKLFITTSLFQTACISSIVQRFQFKRIIIVRLNCSEIPNVFYQLPKIDTRTEITVIDLDLEKNYYETAFVFEVLIFFSKLLIDEVCVASLNNQYVAFVANGFRRKTRVSIFDDGTMAFFFESILRKKKKGINNLFFTFYRRVMKRDIPIDFTSPTNMRLYSFLPIEFWDINRSLEKVFFRYKLSFEPREAFCPMGKKVRFLLGVNTYSGGDAFDESDLLIYRFLINRLKTHLVVPHPKSPTLDNILVLKNGILIEQLVVMLLRQGFRVDIIGQQSTVFWSLERHVNLKTFIIPSRGLRSLDALPNILSHHGVGLSSVSEYMYAEK